MGVLTALVGAVVPLWITFDVVNPAAVGGHRILHLEDIIGPQRRLDIPRLPKPSAVLLFSVRPDACSKDGDCGRVARWTQPARARGGLVIAVVLAERDRADAVRARFAATRLPIAVAVDAHGIVSAVGGLNQPGTYVVIDGKGQSRRWTPAAGRATVSSRDLEQIRGAFRDATR